MHITDYLYMEDLPDDCISQIGKATGAVDNLVDSWRQTLDFTVDRASAIHYRNNFGLDGSNDLSDDDLANFVLFDSACCFHEHKQCVANGEDPSDTSCGTDIICLNC